MKKIAMLLVAALLLFACASAETYVGVGFTITLPDGFAPQDEEQMQGYREAAARDAGAEYEGEALLAVREGASVSVVYAVSDHADTQAAADALIAEYANYVAGFDGVEAQSVEAGPWTYSRIQVALDGETASQYLLLDGGTLYTLTFVGLEEQEMLDVLASFMPSSAQTGQDASAIQPEATTEPEATAEPATATEPETTSEPEATSLALETPAA